MRSALSAAGFGAQWLLHGCTAPVLPVVLYPTHTNPRRLNHGSASGYAAEPHCSTSSRWWTRA